MVGLMETHAPEIPTAVANDDAVEDLDFLRLSTPYVEAPAVSLNYAIAEKAALGGQRRLLTGCLMHHLRQEVDVLNQ